MIIDIGAGTTDFCVMNGRLPTEDDQRTLTLAGDWIDEQLMRLVREHHPSARFSVHMVRGWKEASSFVGEPPAPVKVTVPIDGKPTEIDISPEMRQACEGILPSLVESMFDLLSRVDPEYQERVRNHIILSGGTGLIRGLAVRLERELEAFGGGKVTVVKDPVFVGSDGGLAIAQDAPDADWERLSA
jgi:rod shape-determining protein MreB